ncbi:MAG TPA: glycoside hydrolase family 16 protein [Chitinophagaceae bacterium]|nr:glycoside hydrolase family 16 protein [Chitinophagaceae bacterium]
MKYILVCLLLISCMAGAQEKKWKLVWSDEFNYTGLPDSTKWTEETGGDGWGNNELQYYTAGRKENARVGGGVLTIEARHEKKEGMEFTSARLITKNKGDWQYGKIEVKAKLPRGFGSWPAIWMLGSTTPMAWPDDGEIDIMEHVGFHQGFIHGSIHCQKYNHVINTQKTDTVEIKDCSESFHVYGLEWSRDTIRVSVDSKVFFTFANEHSGYAAWPFDNKMFLLLNIAVGGNWGGQKGVAGNIWPLRMQIDYVRVYQQ